MCHVGRVGTSDSAHLILDLFSDVGGPADPIAPTIIIPPKNTSVVAGTSEVTMECVANARWVALLCLIPYQNCSQEQVIFEKGPEAWSGEDL